MLRSHQTMASRAPPCRDAQVEPVTLGEKAAASRDPNNR